MIVKRCRYKSEDSISFQVGGGLWSHTAEGRTDDLASAQVVMTGSVNGQPMRNCQVAEGIKKHTFGDGLTEVEKKWVVSELATFLKSVNPGYRWDIDLNFGQRCKMLNV